MIIHQSFRPAYVMSPSASSVTALLALVLIGTPACLMTGLLGAPLDLQQGELARLPYVHVPAARISLGVYCATASSVVLLVVTKHPLVLLSARSGTALVAWSTGLVLVTGWFRGLVLKWHGSYWNWDARMTSVLLSFLIALGSLRLQKLPVAPGPFSLLAGTIDLPLLTSSVNWWNTSHQPGSMSRSGTAIHEPMNRPIWSNVALSSCAAFLLFVLETRLPIPSFSEERMG
uniref:Cytochrome c biogenesis C n=1 Tax=Viscum crassulae TaxID=1522199 RepID=A0A0R5KCD0_9MAGN|nr:cytochrome c biogenesis C [Viscum crassulae]